MIPIKNTPANRPNGRGTLDTSKILEIYSNRGEIIAKRTPENTGNKSSAQEFGLQFVTGDIVVTTDADTVLEVVIVVVDVVVCELLGDANEFGAS